MILAIVAVVVVAALAFGVVSWRRHQAVIEASTPQVEVPLPPEALADQAVPGAVGATYRGAADAGAYEPGGAAYAQHVGGATYAAAGAPTATATGLKQKIVAIADQQLVRIGKHGVIAAKLEAGGSRAKPGEWFATTVGLVLASVAIGVLMRNPVIAIFGAGASMGGSWIWLTRKEGQRKKLFAGQLPETLGMLAAGLRAGMSMMQALQNVALEAESPTSDEFTRLLTEVRLGRDLGVAFHEMADRMESDDFRWVVNAIEIHREVGGDLAEILDRLAGTIRARNRVLGQMKALSAEGRASGIILFILPPAMVLLISVLNPSYFSEMTGSALGIGLLVLAAVLLGIGGLWMKKLVKFRY